VDRIVFQLLTDRNFNELIKSKSMLTEECDTRRFLEERGIRFSETDLGERIQQLDDQPPSHIVGPVSGLFAGFWCKLEKLALWR
jgi:L-lactate dehydrogenase complex protein LldF